MKQKLVGILKLTRYHESFGFIFLLTMAGAFAASASSLTRLVLVLIANFLTISVAYMINDIEDAEDDAKHPQKSKRNPISAKMISPLLGHVATFVTIAIALVIFYFLGRETLVVGALTLALSYIYSLRKIRLKSMPLIDVISHSFFFGAGPVLIAYFAFATDLQPVLTIVLAVTLFSVGGDIVNELRDYEVDRQTNINNTAGMLGKPLSEKLQLVLMIGSLLLFMYFFFMDRQQFSLVVTAIGVAFIAILAYWAKYIQKESLGEYHHYFSVLAGLILLLSLIFK